VRGRRGRARPRSRRRPMPQGRYSLPSSRSGLIISGM
jgi:hypothetical protein